MGSPSSSSETNQLSVEASSGGGAGVINSLYFEIHSSDEFGRYLVAKEDIDEKTLILSEAPLLFGPSDDMDLESDTVFLFCLACCKQLTSKKKKTLNSSECESSSSKRDQDNNDTDHGDGCNGLSDQENAHHYHCSKCGWPVCDKYCEMSPVHSDQECKFFTFLHHNQSSYPPPHEWLMYKSVILLRLLLLIHKDPHEVWDLFLEKLEHHTETRDEKPNCVRADEIIIENLQHFTQGLKGRRNSKKKKKYNLPYLGNEVMLRRLIGTINVNAFCANNDSSKRIARCMFKNASLFAHSCAPNSGWSIEMSLADPPTRISLRKRKSKNGFVGRAGYGGAPMDKVTPEIQIYSAIFIKKGELVTIPYSTRHIFDGTLKRQLCMESVGHFICKCRRCMDPTELGTFMSAIRCFRCEKGFLVTVDPSNEESPWICVKVNNVDNDDCTRHNGIDSEEPDCESKCDYKCNVGKVVYFTTIVQDQVDWIRSKELDWLEEQDELQRVYDKYFGKDLHEHHYLFHEMSTRIVELLEERLTVSDSDLPEQKRLKKDKREILLGRFLHHVKYLIKIADMILPGFNSHQDQLKYYLEEAEALINTPEENST